MEIKPNTKIDFGELVLTLAKNALHITPRLQNAIASYLEYQSAPKMIIKPVEVKL